jgi:hypothetical protein
MGLFDWLFRRRGELRSRVWVDEAALLRGLANDVRGDLAAGRHAVVVAHFEDGLVEAGQALAAADVPFATVAQWQRADTERLRTAPPHAVAVLARALPAGGAMPEPKAQGARAVAVRMRELHVLATANERVQRFAAELPVPAELTGYASLASPTMARVAGPSLRALMQRLGMKDDEPIDSPFVASALRRTLAKLARRVHGDLPARSLADWLQRNLPA